MDKYIRSVSLIDGHVEEITETEVIKALECCGVGKDKCRKCPFYCAVPACSRYLAQFALDFINRLQKENKDKDKVIKRLVDNLSIPPAEEDEDWYAMPQLKTPEEIESETIEKVKRRLKENISVIHIGDNETMRVVQEVAIERILKEIEGESQ